MVSFEKMRVEGDGVDVISLTTMVSVLSICSELAVLRSGREIYGLVIEYGFELFTGWKCDYRHVC